MKKYKNGNITLTAQELSAIIDQALKAQALEESAQAGGKKETPKNPRPSKKGAYDHSDKVGPRMSETLRTRYANRVSAGRTPEEAIKSIHKHYGGKYTLDTIRAIVGE